ncbi:MAG: serine O-acetyltransferase [Planctomyces sp.]|jgi:serine O-acetyltransferase
MYQASMDRGNFDELVSTLMNQQNRSEGHEGTGCPLPSVTGVLGVAADLREVLFPGVHGVRRPEAVSQEFELKSLLGRIQIRLRAEIERALCHSRNAEVRIFRGDSTTEEAPRRKPEFGGDERAPRTAVNPSLALREADEMTMRFLNLLPELRRRMMTDVDAAFDGDPAAKTREEILLCYPGIQAIYTYRIAHELHLLGVPYLPRIMTESAHRETGIDIHPGAEIGESFFIDHGTGVVIGETCIIGNHVTLYQGVTLGAWSFPRDAEGQLIRGTKRHPTLEDGVTVYSNATILGGTTVIGEGSQIGSSVSLNRSIPPNTIVTIERPLLKFREAA